MTDFGNHWLLIGKFWCSDQVVEPENRLLVSVGDEVDKPWFLLSLNDVSRLTNDLRPSHKHLQRPLGFHLFSLSSSNLSLATLCPELQLA